MIEELLAPILNLLFPYRWEVCVVEHGAATPVSITRTYLGAKRRSKLWSRPHQVLMVRRKP